MIKILSLDTTSRYSSISISRGEEIILEYNFATLDDLSETLAPSIESALKSAHEPLNLEDIDVFGIGIGPGLFTGIRVGMATLKGILFGTGKPVAPVNMLEAAAYKYDDSTLPIVSMIDARRKEVYTAVYRFEDREPAEISAPALVGIDRLKEHLDQVFKPGEDFYFVGSGAEAYRDFIRENFNRARVLHRSLYLASEICAIAYRKYMKNQCITDLRELTPFYIRKPDAEQNYAGPEGKP
jgi:tRNA threonylcarbamoyladenosine biosynthesis protein TsaB